MACPELRILVVHEASKNLFDNICYTLQGIMPYFLIEDKLHFFQATIKILRRPWPFLIRASRKIDL